MRIGFCNGRSAALAAIVSSARGHGTRYCVLDPERSGGTRDVLQQKLAAHAGRRLPQFPDSQIAVYKKVVDRAKGQDG